MNISMNMALTMAHTLQPTSKTSLLKTSSSDNCLNRSKSAASPFSLYKGLSNRPLGWKRSPRNPELRSGIRNMNMRRWDGAARTSTEWDSLRKDTELWYPEGNCNVHLYGRGQSRRGPAFKIPIEALVETNCQPLVHRFLAERYSESPSLSDSSHEDGDFFNSTSVELYIPAPPMTTEKGQAFLYHTATRNFFAWMFGKPLVGHHLGGALVGLLNSMAEFRSQGEDNVQAAIDYIDEEGYADMRNQPDHALAILFFAEHFQFKDMWIDAFAHCVGMYELLIFSPGYEFISRTSRALITRSRLEMNVRLDHCGRRLGTFLEDDLSDTRLGLSAGARAHLDKFRSFLQSHFVAKLGYYPPTSCSDESGGFPKSIYAQMTSEFQKLYDFLADTSVTSSEPAAIISQQGGICVIQSVQAFDQRHKCPPLPYPVPLLPEVEESNSKKPMMLLNKRFTRTKTDKMKLDPRLVAYSAITKATNRRDSVFYDCSLVRAYRSFEKNCIFEPSKADKNDKLSATDARKVRWILIYTILQTLLSATRIPAQVRDIQNLSYNLCVLTAGCPPWKEERPIEKLLRSQTDQTREDYRRSQDTPNEFISQSIKPDIDYAAIIQRPQASKANSESGPTVLKSRKGTVRRALSTLGNMPEMHHPRPKRASYHEIVVHGYGNGTNNVSIAAGPSAEEEKTEAGNSLIPASWSSDNLSSRHSQTSDDGEEPQSPTTSTSSDHTRRGSAESYGKDIMEDLLDRPTSTIGLRKPSSTYSTDIYGGDPTMYPHPLHVREGSEDHYMMVTKAVTVEWEENVSGASNEELRTYLDAN